MMRNGIPEGWLDYKSCGRVIDGTKIICFKVPLRTKIQTRNPKVEEIWDIKALREKIPNLGAVIDLTNSKPKRYYDAKELTDLGVIHKKIMMPGRIIPPQCKVQLFMDTVDELLGKNGDLLLGVHCTHGLNRTGYMVCRYMRDRLHVPADVAIKKFEKARGYQIIRANFVAHLLGKELPAPDPFDEQNGAQPKKKSRNKKNKISNWRDECQHASSINVPSSSSAPRKRNSDVKITNWRDECQYPASKKSKNEIKPSSDGESGKSNSEFDFSFDY